MKGDGYITVASGAVYLQQDSVPENTRVLTSRKHAGREKGEGRKSRTLKIKVFSACILTPYI